MKIIFIQTGGTIDKDYPHTTKGWAFEFGEPAFKRILEKLAPSFEYECITAFQKDSLEVTEGDRVELAELILAQSSSKIVVTHGTDTLLDTAAILSSRVKNKVVVLTGAMRPERFSNSEAPINLGMAIATVNLKQEGVFVAMHGIVKPWQEMKRNLEDGKFY